MEVDAFALDLRPLFDDRPHEEAEDEHGKPELEGDPDFATARGLFPDFRPGLADSVQEWLAALHVRRTLVFGIVG
jgi:hypothetical protein